MVSDIILRVAHVRIVKHVLFDTNNNFLTASRWPAAFGPAAVTLRGQPYIRYRIKASEHSVLEQGSNLRDQTGLLDELCVLMVSRWGWALHPHV